MSKRTNPDTSNEAYKSLTPEKLRHDYKRIVEALKVLGMATYEEISDHTNCREPNVISRRMKELEGMHIVWKPGTKRLTKRKRLAYCYQLTNNQPKVETNQTKKSNDFYFSDPDKVTLEDMGFKQGDIVFLD